MKISEVEKLVNSNTFCVLPWIHLSTRPGGTVRVCCTANASSVSSSNDKKYGSQVGLLKNSKGEPENVNDRTFLEIWNGDYMKNVRTKMMNNEKPASCLKCYKEEGAGHRSKRQWETEYWSSRVNISELVNNTSKEGEVAPKLYYVDLRLGTKCQLACVMCSPHDSSSWIREWNEIYPEVKNESLKETMGWDKKGADGKYNWHKNNPKFWQEFYEQIPYFRQLYFAGGEATITKEHYDILEKVVEMGYAHQIELRYNSNGLELPSKLFELWSKFEKVRFHYSVDDIFKRNEYIRYPSDWNVVENNFKILDNTGDNIEITVACAVQALNIFYIPDFVKWKLEQGYKKINPWPLGAGLINWHFVYHPPHLNVKVLPKWFKEKCRAKYENFYSWMADNWSITSAPNKDDFIHSNYGINRMRGMINFMESEDWSNRLPELREYISIIDAKRKTSFSETFPEMNDIFKDL